MSVISTVSTHVFEVKDWCPIAYIKSIVRDYDFIVMHQTAE